MTSTKKPSLAETHPELAAQADGWDPKTVTFGSHKKVDWRCAIGHAWSAPVKNRANGSGCPICVNKTALSGFNDLATTHPSLAEQAHGFDPQKYVAGSGVKLEWECNVGHRWFSTIKDRVAGNGCPYCSGRKAIKGETDLATKDPSLAAEAFEWDPTTVSEKSNLRRRWKCKNDHVYESSVDSRSRGTGCPYCSGNKVLKGYNDLVTTNPELAAQADGWDPTSVMAGSNTIRPWMCDKGHHWKAMVLSRNQGNNCPVCSNKSVLIGFNDLYTTNHHIATEALGWDPRTVTRGSKFKGKWQCEYGHEWTATINDRNSGHNCPVCSGHTVLAGFNDLVTTHPEIAAQASGWDPTTVTAGSSKKRRWICEEGHSWLTVVNSRLAGRGCPTCAKFGFDPNQSGFLYLIDHFDLHMFQIGITNNPEDRLGRHKRRGWEVIELRGPMDGHLTQNLETSCLHALEKRGAILGHKAGIKKFDGYSEAWTKASLNVTSIKQILDWVYEDES